MRRTGPTPAAPPQTLSVLAQHCGAQACAERTKATGAGIHEGAAIFRLDPAHLGQAGKLGVGHALRDHHGAHRQARDDVHLRPAP